MHIEISIVCLGFRIPYGAKEYVKRVSVHYLIIIFDLSN